MSRYYNYLLSRKTCRLSLKIDKTKIVPMWKNSVPAEENIFSFAIHKIEVGFKLDLKILIYLWLKIGRKDILN